MTEDIVICDACGQKNRLPFHLPAGKKAVCGGCGSDLDDAEIVDDQDDDDEDAS
jgi:uncharacterized paraquat-inducible protein A